MKSQDRKIKITYALQRGLADILRFGLEDKYEVAKKAFAHNQHRDRNEILESIEDAQEFIRQVSLGLNHQKGS